MDPYNPLIDSVKNYEECEQLMNQQNLIYGADTWYSLIKDYTIPSYLLKLNDKQIKCLANGEVPQDLSFRDKVTSLIIDEHYRFVKSTHKSSYPTKPMNSFEDFENEITDANVVMSFRRYGCKYLFFRRWETIPFECRVYVYQKKVRYIEESIDPEQKFRPEMFASIRHFVQKCVVPALDTVYESFTVDVYHNEMGLWRVLEVNSPLWLKAGTYRINYSREKDRIHSSTDVICRFATLEGGMYSDEILLS